MPVGVIAAVPRNGVLVEENLTDAKLVEKVRRGDSHAFDTLVRRHLAAAHGVAMNQLGNANDAEDVCQDAFLSALTNIEQCREPAQFRSWLLAIVRNRAHNYRSYQRVREARPLDAGVQIASPDDPSRSAERVELRERMSEALAELTGTQREVVLLHDYEGWAHGEIAERLGISHGASRFHLHVARKALRARLSRYETKGE